MDKQAQSFSVLPDKLVSVVDDVIDAISGVPKLRDLSRLEISHVIIMAGVGVIAACAEEGRESMVLIAASAMFAEASRQLAAPGESGEVVEEEGIAFDDEPEHDCGESVCVCAEGGAS